MTPNQATLFFASAYVITVLILAFCYWKGNALDIRRRISKKTFLKRFGLVVAAIVIGIAGMTGIYLLRLPRETTIWAVGGFQLLMSVIADTLLFASWTQRISIYPRGNVLSLVVILMYAVADLFMPGGVKYGVLLVGTLVAVLLPSAWEE